MLVFESEAFRGKMKFLCLIFFATLGVVHSNNCAFPADTRNFGVITKLMAKIGAKLTYGNVAVGGWLQMVGSYSKVVNSELYEGPSYAKTWNVGGTNFKTGIRQLDNIQDVIDFEQFEWLARNLVETQKDSNGARETLYGTACT